MDVATRHAEYLQASQTPVAERRAVVPDAPTQLDDIQHTLLDSEPRPQSPEEENLPPFSAVTIEDIFSDSDEEGEEGERKEKGMDTPKSAKSLVDAFFGSGDGNAEEHEEGDSERLPKKKEGRGAGTHTHQAAGAESPSSVKSFSMDLSDDDDEERDGEQDNGKPAPLATRNEENQRPLNAVARSEMEAVKRLERGPTEAELRRRALIEMDEDELEERIEHFNKVGLQAISRATGLQRQERQARLRETRLFLKQLLAEDSKDAAKEIEKQLDKHMRRIFPSGTEVKESPWDYLDRDDYSDDEENDTAEDATAQPADDVIYLSDSDSDSEAAPSAPPPRLPAPSSPPASSRSQAWKRALLTAVHRFPKPSRSALLTSLRQQVQAVARDNYCQQRRIPAQELALQLEISEKCRVLLVCLREKWEEEAQRSRNERQQRYRETAQDDEEEFDETGGWAEGQFLTEEEKAELLREMYREDEEEEEEGEEGEDEEEEEEGEGMEVEEEAAEEEAAEEEPKSPPALAAETPSPPPPQALEADPDLQIAEESGDLEGETEDGPAHRPRKVFGRDRPPDVRETTEAAAGDDEVVDSDPEREPTAEAAPSAPRSRRPGNALFRLQLEEEERRLRQRGKSRLLDDEAAEGDEDDDDDDRNDPAAGPGGRVPRGQASGLGDFGFGSLRGAQEAAEEQAALRYRRGDLDHIVDALGSDEDEDSEEAARRRAEQDEARDRLHTRRIIEAVTLGHDKARAGGAALPPSGFSFDRLVRGGGGGGGGGGTGSGTGEPAGRGGGGEGDDEGAAGDYDEEEALMRGMDAKAARLREQNQRRGTRQTVWGEGDGLDSDASSDWDDGDEDEEDEDGEGRDGDDGDGDGEGAEGTHREAGDDDAEEAASRRAAQRAWRRQMAQAFRMQRELRRVRALQTRPFPPPPSLLPPPAPPSSSSSSSSSSSQPGPAEALADITNCTPRGPRRLSAETRKQIAAMRPSPLLPGFLGRATQARPGPRPSAGVRVSPAAPGAGLPAASTAGSSVPGPATSLASHGPRSSRYCGELTRLERDCGLGMGMALPAADPAGLFSLVTQQASSSSSSALTHSLSAVGTPRAGAASGPAPAPAAGLKRSFAGAFLLPAQGEQSNSQMPRRLAGSGAGPGGGSGAGGGAPLLVKRAVSGPSFVFTETSSASRPTGTGHSQWSAPGTSHTQLGASRGGGAGMGATAAEGEGGRPSSLFEKLKRSNSVVR